MSTATARLRDAEKTALCDALAAVAAGVPTLCEGWIAHDLAAHVWVLKHEPAGWAEAVLPQVRYLPRVKRRWSYAQLVRRLRNDDSRILAMPLDPRAGDGHAIGEYFVHCEDVRRANDLPVRHYSDELQDALWQRVQPPSSTSR